MKPCSVNDDRCKPSTFGTTWTLGGVTSRTSLKCLPPLDSPERIFGGISSSQSSARTPMRRAATLEKTWKMSNRNGRIRSIISSNTRRMSLALLALIWIEPFLALTLTTLQHFRQLKTQKLCMHVDGRPRKVRTVSRGEPCLMYETRLSRMIMQLPPAQMANRDGDAGMETMLWDINTIPNELDNGYLMLPPGVLHMSALGRFGRFTLFSPRVSHSKHLPVFCFVLCFGLGGVCCFVVFLFPVLQVFGIPNSPRSLDLDDRQGFIASSAMQQKKKGVLHMSALGRFGRFTLFSPRVSHSKHLPVFCFVLCFGFGGVCCLVVFLFPVLQVFGIPNSPRSLDLDDRQGFIASSAMQQKKKRSSTYECVGPLRTFHPLLTSRFTFQTLAGFLFCVVFWVWGCLLLGGVFVSSFASVWNPEFSAQFRPR